MIMLITRRRFFKTAGASVVVLGAGATGFVLTRSPAQALRPWESAGENSDSRSSDARLQALSYAILAPNPHNRQPWLVKLRGDDAFDLHCDLERRLPATDPFDRQITIGLGCFLELFRIAAARDGFEARIERFPLGEPQPRLDERPIARVSLVKTALQNDPLFDHILKRRSNKEAFDTARPVSETTMRRITNESGAEARATFSLDPALLERMRAFTFRAMQTEIGTRDAAMESLNLMRIGKAEINANPDGIDIGGVMPDLLHKVGVLTRETISDTNSVAFGKMMEGFQSIMASAMDYVWVVSPGNSRRDQLRAGADWLRLNLSASKSGVSLSPLSQALQEFPEMAKLFKELHRELGVETPMRIQMFGRVGYGPEVAPSPRWPLQTRILPS